MKTTYKLDTLVQLNDLKNINSLMLIDYQFFSNVLFVFPEHLRQMCKRIEYLFCVILSLSTLNGWCERGGGGGGRGWVGKNYPTLTVEAKELQSYFFAWKFLQQCTFQKYIDMVPSQHNFCRRQHF